MKLTGYEIDKLQIASLRLADTIHGFYAGNSTITTVDNARAANTIIRDIREFYQKRQYIPPTELWSDDRTTEHPRDAFWVASSFSGQVIRSLSNFTKHAKTDSDAVKEVWPFVDILALTTASIDYGQLLHVLRKSGLVQKNKGAYLKTPYSERTREESIVNTIMHFTIDWGRNKNEVSVKQKYKNILEQYNLWPLNEDDLVRLDRSGPVPFRKKEAPTDSIDHLKGDWADLSINHPLNKGPNT